MKRDPKIRKPNVLAVDDYPANLVALQAVLSDDYNLVFANSAAEAISTILARRDIDVILMDIQMPEMDGFEAAAEIKKINGAEDIPIIFITAIYKEDPFIKKGYAVGGIDYFSKPFDPEILKLKIDVYAAFRQKAEVLKERERQIKETEELLSVGRKLSEILEGLPCGVLISDVDGRICQTNALVSQICGSTSEDDAESYSEMLGWWDTNGKVIKGKNAPLHRALHSGEITHSEIIQLTCKDGASRRVLCSASPLNGLDGHIVGAVVVLQDVTESKKIEEDLEKRITRLVSIGVEIEESIHH
jgi:PAS domain S-box-containing protein